MEPTEESKFDLYECKHCSLTGTCSNGENNTSCSACVKTHGLPLYRFFKEKKYFGLRCGSCGGLITTDLYTNRMVDRLKPLLSIGIVGVSAALSLFAGAMDNELLPQVLTAWTAVVGLVVGYHFTEKR